MKSVKNDDKVLCDDILTATDKAFPFGDDVLDYGLFEHIWPEFCFQVVNYCEIILSKRVNSLGFSIHGPTGSGKTLFAKCMATRFSSEVHYGSAVDWIYAYGKYLDSPLKNILVSAPTQKPILLIIDDADHWVVGKKSLEKKTMCGFIEELDSCRNLQQRILWILITREENQLHPILRRDEYFPHSFCVPSLSRENIHHMVSYWLEKIDNPTISRVALDLVQRENMIPGWKGCVFGHISYLVTTFLRMVYCKGGDHDSIAKQWQRSLEATFSFVVQNNPEIGISNHKPSSNFIVDDFLVGSDDESSLSETFNDLVTVITYSMKKNQQVFPTTVTPFRGALIYGPCGVGKTSLCHRLVQKLHLPVFVLDGASLLASAIGQSEKTLKQCFLAARRFSPCVIFVDQIDMVFQKRDFADGTSAESLSRLTCLFLSEMDGFSTSRQPEFFVLATAQDLDKIDPALLRPGRLEYKKKLDLPTNYQRSHRGEASRRQPISRLDRSKHLHVESCRLVHVTAFRAVVLLERKSE
ncbi:Nuclear valosin-containing protein [Galdieria sulphuraria]|nr:Nuclear valosin-containing protein [Galdieria sulphuraria]